MIVSGVNPGVMDSSLALFGGGSDQMGESGVQLSRGPAHQLHGAGEHPSQMQTQHSQDGNFPLSLLDVWGTGKSEGCTSDTLDRNVPRNNRMDPSCLNH